MKVETPINLKILRQCREQMSLTVDDVQKEIKTIQQIEAGERNPTFRQLDELADLYGVPRWVFIANELPETYHYAQKPAFRKYKNTFRTTDRNIPRLIARVEQYRDLYLELKRDMGEDITDFSPPESIRTKSPENAAAIVREWLPQSNSTGLDSLRSRLEQKSIFVFLTDVYRGWSHIDRAFRGLSIYDKQFPIIIINATDWRKAQSFTLFHELAHLLRGATEFDNWQTEATDEEEERW